MKKNNMNVFRFFRPVSLVVLILLTACHSPLSRNDTAEHQVGGIPDQQLPDYLLTSCSHIWLENEPSSLSNPLYWLRAMECAERLSPSAARDQAVEYRDVTRWPPAFKRAILLSGTRVNAAERRRYMSELDTLAQDIPLSVRSLFVVWRDGQRAQLMLAEERNRNNQQQAENDRQLDALREQQQAVQHRLDLTTKKLESLSDIERQLSSRKPASALQENSP